MNMLTALAPPEALLAHAPALTSVGPILIAALIMALRLPAALFSILACVFGLWMSIGLAATTSRDISMEYAFGGWDSPIGIVFHVDPLSSLIALILSGIGLLCAIANSALIPKTLAPEQGAQAHAAFLICLGGLLGVTLTGDVFNLFVFVEISSLSAYALIALGGGQDRRSLKAAFNYLILGSIGASFYLIGIGFLYAITGTLNMQDMAARLLAHGDSRALMAALVFIVTGLGLKAALFPLHSWLPASYAYAPSFVTAFLSATATKAAIYALARLLFDVFSPDMAVLQIMLGYFLAPLAAVGIVICSVQALLQTDIRLILAYSSIAQAGYMLLAMSLGSASGMLAALFTLCAHALMKSPLFMALGAIPPRNTFLLKNINGAGFTAPVTMGAFALCGLSLAGMPLTLGFAGKWVLLSALSEAGRYWAVALVAGSSILGFLYVGRILEAAYLRAPPDESDNRITDAPFAVLLPLLTLGTANLVFGLQATPLLEMAQAAAFSLLAPPGALP